jgi:hypothetical protein
MCRGKNKSKMFWNMLKGLRGTINPSQIIDPVSKTVMFEEKVEIETCLSEHFSKIGTDINIAQHVPKHLRFILTPTHLSLKKLILLLTCLLTIASCNCFFRLWYRADNCLPSSLSYGRVLFCKRCSRLASRLRFKILSRPLSQNSCNFLL